MVSVKNLHKTYGSGQDRVEALKGIDFEVQKGEIFGIIGLSGAGKSSIVRCLNLLEKPDEGQILIGGNDLTQMGKKELRNVRKKIGMIFQHFNLLMNATVYDNIAFPLKISGLSKEEIQKRVEELLALVDLEEKRDAYPSKLSGGQKQRVGIARALAAYPDVIVCDEATSALDPTTTKSILSLLRTINQKLGMTIIIITHEMEVIREICHRVAIIENGKILEQGKISQIYVNPKTETAKKFLKTVDTNLNNPIYKRAVEEGGIVVKAVFLGEQSTDPYISKMVKTYDVEAAILLGNIQQMDGMLIGTLVLRIDGTPENMEKALDYLRQNDVIVEVLQYGA